MTEIMFVSVVVPTYNNKNSLKNTIESLCNQSYSKDKYEIIVVDDGSIDSTRQLIEQEQEKCLCNFRYFYQENRGPAAARNLGVRYARGDIIAFTDSDCTASYTWIEEIVKGYDNERVAGIGGVVIAMPTTSMISQYCAYIRMNERPPMDRYGIVYIITASASFRKDYLNLAGGFDERHNSPGGEEPDLCYRLKKKGYFFKYNRNAIVYSYHKESLRGLLKTYFNYGKGDYFLILRKQSNWELICAFVLKCFLYIMRFPQIPFKALLYYAEGLTVKTALTYAFLDYTKQLFFAQGTFLGYVLGRFKGFKKDDFSQVSISR